MTAPFCSRASRSRSSLRGAGPGPPAPVPRPLGVAAAPLRCAPLRAAVLAAAGRWAAALRAATLPVAPLRAADLRREREVGVMLSVLRSLLLSPAPRALHSSHARVRPDAGFRWGYTFSRL